MIEDRKYEIGCRIECEGYRGTLKYIGHVGDTKGEWLGVDWDDPTRGKHNGTYQGVEYFKARHSTSGSFVRLGKAICGISCVQAIVARYGLVDDELAGINRENLETLQKKMKAPFLEMVGFSKVNKKQSNFHRLEIACLREEGISGAGKPDELKDLCPNLRELDISRNLLNSWTIVADICCQLSFLFNLNVDGNELPVDENLISLKTAFSTITHLSMARMNYNWLDMQMCLRMFESLRELSISFNVVDTIEESFNVHNILKNVSTLILEGNLLSNWNEIIKLGTLPCLNYLNLNSNKINKIQFETDQPTDKTLLFSALKRLYLSNNNISDWESVSELEKLVNLEDLQFRNNPVSKKQNIETTRQLIIARISKLKILNGSEILRDERNGAEYDYLKMHFTRWKEIENDLTMRDQFINDHPRYCDLVKKCGITEVPSLKTKMNMLSNIITVEFMCPADPNQSKPIKKKIPKNIQVQKVIGVVQKLFNTDGKIPSLSFVQDDLSQEEIPLDKPLQELDYYSIQNGDRVLVRW